MRWRSMKIWRISAYPWNIGIDACRTTILWKVPHTLFSQSNVLPQHWPAVGLLCRPWVSHLTRTVQFQNDNMTIIIHCAHEVVTSPEWWSSTRSVDRWIREQATRQRLSRTTPMTRWRSASTARRSGWGSSRDRDATWTVSRGTGTLLLMGLSRYYHRWLEVLRWKKWCKRSMLL